MYVPKSEHGDPTLPKEHPDVFSAASVVALSGQGKSASGLRVVRESPAAVHPPPRMGDELCLRGLLR